MAISQIESVGLGSTAQYPGFKNRIINGDMRIDQRNAGAAVTPGTSVSLYVVDRWYTVTSANTGSKVTVQQNAGSVTPPAGFSNYLGYTNISAYTPTGLDQLSLRQTIEGVNASDLGWGTVNAQPTTLSFVVRSSLTGTFSGSIYNSSANRVYVFSFSIFTANTWEYKMITIPGDTTGTWLTNNSAGLTIQFNLGNGPSFLSSSTGWGSTYYAGLTGSQSPGAVSGATFYITGVQLEKGSVATSFDFRSVGQELALCQRYYAVVSGFSGYGYFSGGLASLITTVPLPVTMRAAPTVTITSSGAITAGYSTAVYGASGLSAFSYQVISNAAGTGGSLLASATAAIEL